MQSTISIPRLRAALNGRVITPGDTGYDHARTVFYGGFDRRPQMIVRPADAAEVARVVELAAALGPGRQALPVRHRRRAADPGGAVRRPLPAAGLPLHVRSQLPAGDPVNSSIADTLDALAPHLQARDLTVVLVSQAPLAKLQAYQRRMGWRLGWVSAAPSDFNLDLGASVPEQRGQAIVPPQAGLPPIVAQNAAAAGTDVCGYLSQAPVVSAFVLQDGVVYQSYGASWRGVEVLMGSYPILDRMPKGRDEGDSRRLWLRRHDEYGNRRRLGR
jgi:predicted dithiol-disulfide oxidoreductase (DUF899 family)